MPTSTFRTVDKVTAGSARDVGAERRATFQLMAYWDELRADRALPTEDDIDPNHAALRDIWNQCFVVQVRDFASKDFNYTYLGPGIIDAYREELREHTGTKIVSLTASKLMDIYKQIMAERRPLVHMGEFTDERGSIVKFRQCLLPFGHDKVDVIFGHMTYQVFTC
jgi:hypothetical protein